MISWTRPPRWIRYFYQSSIWQTADRQSIAFSFDDGPGEITPMLLNWAEKTGVKLVFFGLPEQMKKSPDIVKSAASEGHIVGTHFLNHHGYLLKDKVGFQAELRKSVQLLEEIIDKPVKFCRVPYGRIFPWQQQWISELGLTHVFWTMDLKDYRQWSSVATIQQKVRKSLKAGDIILMHDGLVYKPEIIDILDFIVEKMDFIISKGL